MKRQLLVLALMIAVVLCVLQRAGAQQSRSLTLHRGSVLSLMARCGCDSSQLASVVALSHINEAHLETLAPTQNVRLPAHCHSVASPAVAKRSAQILFRENLRSAARRRLQQSSLVRPKEVSPTPAPVFLPQHNVSHFSIRGWLGYGLVAVLGMVMCLGVQWLLHRFVPQFSFFANSEEGVTGDIEYLGKSGNFEVAAERKYRCLHCNENNILRKNRLRHLENKHSNLFGTLEDPVVIVRERFAEVA